MRRHRVDTESSSGAQSRRGGRVQATGEPRQSRTGGGTGPVGALHAAVGNQAVSNHERGGGQSTLTVSSPTDRAEREAERVAEAVVRDGEAVSVRRTTEREGVVWRQEAGGDTGRAGSGSGGEGEATGYEKLRRVEIEVDPEPVAVYHFPVSGTAPGEASTGPSEFIKERIEAGDEAMLQAANDAGLIVLSEKSLEEFLPVPSFPTSEDINWEMTAKTIELYQKYRKRRREKGFPDLDVPAPPSPTAEGEPEPEQTLYFEYDSTEFSELTTDADWEATVQQVVAYVRNVHESRGVKPGYRGVTPTIAVHGYASPEGETEYNQTLSDRRAARVAELLAERLAEAGFSFDDYVVYGVGEGEKEQELVVY